MRVAHGGRGRGDSRVFESGCLPCVPVPGAAESVPIGPRTARAHSRWAVLVRSERACSVLELVRTHARARACTRHACARDVCAHVPAPRQRCRRHRDGSLTADACTCTMAVHAAYIYTAAGRMQTRAAVATPRRVPLQPCPWRCTRAARRRSSTWSSQFPCLCLSRRGYTAIANRYRSRSGS